MSTDPLSDAEAAELARLQRAAYGASATALAAQDAARLAHLQACRGAPRQFGGRCAPAHTGIGTAPAGASLPSVGAPSISAIRDDSRAPVPRRAQPLHRLRSVWRRPQTKLFLAGAGCAAVAVVLVAAIGTLTAPRPDAVLSVRSGASQPATDLGFTMWNTGDIQASEFDQVGDVRVLRISYEDPRKDDLARQVTCLMGAVGAEPRATACRDMLHPNAPLELDLVAPNAGPASAQARRFAVDDGLPEPVDVVDDGFVARFDGDAIRLVLVDERTVHVWRAPDPSR